MNDTLMGIFIVCSESRFLYEAVEKYKHTPNNETNGCQCHEQNAVLHQDYLPYNYCLLAFVYSNHILK